MNIIYPRRLQKELQSHINTPEIIVLTGMRRVGKTTLYRSIFDEIKTQNKVFLDLENPVTQRIFEEEDYNNIVVNLREYGISEKLKAYIFLDEVQAMPVVVRAVKYLYDHYSFKFFLTGSSSFYLKNLFPESLSGRKFVFNLYPLDFDEFLVFKDEKKESFESFSQKDNNKNKIRHDRLKSSYEEYLKYGGFPQVVLEPEMKRKDMHLQDIFKSYFEKDVQGLAKFREIRLFRDLILLLMSRIASRLDITRLSNELGISRETVYSYISFLENTFFVSLVQPFTKSADKLVVKAKKVYFCDTGLVRSLSDVTEGSIFENAVFNNLRRYNKVQYYQKISGREIDFIIDGKTGLEVKTKGIPSDLKQLKNMAWKIGLKESYVVTKEYVELIGFIIGVDL